MKVLSLIPKKIKRMYGLKRKGHMLYIHRPSFIGLFLDSSFKVRVHGNIVMIENRACSIDLSRDTLRTHTTIF